MRLEAEYGVPCVAVHAHVFARLVAASTRANGMPRIRHAFVPQPVADQPPARLLHYIEGDDPVAARPFARQLFDSLTRPLTQEDIQGATFERTTARVLEFASDDDAHRSFLDEGWTDTLPIVLPTEERVEEMLRGSSRRADEVVGVLRPTEHREYWQFTVEQVAINAVMAGARPEYLPVILAMLASRVTARHSSTSSLSAMGVVNGPIRNELKMNSGLGALGPYNHANSTIGRAFGLGSQNLQGGSVPGVSYMGSLGNSFAYTNLTFPENEEQCPWDPCHVRQGYDRDSSTVTLFRNCQTFISTSGIRETWQERMASMLSALDPVCGGIFLLGPFVANELVEKGLDTPAKIAEWAHEHARKPAREWWDGFDAQIFWKPAAELGVEPFATYLKAEPEDMIPVFEPEDIEVIVVGGDTLPHWAVLNGISHGIPRGGIELGATVAVDEWR
jgi:hypothetical protein